MRERGFPRPRAQACGTPGRTAGTHVDGGLRHGHEFQLQYAPASGRGDGRRRPGLAGPRARAGRATLRIGASPIGSTGLMSTKARYAIIACVVLAVAAAGAVTTYFSAGSGAKEKPAAK